MYILPWLLGIMLHEYTSLYIGLYLISTNFHYTYSGGSNYKIHTMRKITVKNRVIEFYDSIDEMPIVNFQKFNKYLLIDSGIGSDAEDIDRHISKIAKFIKTDSKKAMMELQNMRQNIYMVVNEISPKHLAFAALIHSIDGKRVLDYSDENLKSILKDLQHVKRNWLIDLIMELKKKVNSELEMYFPAEFIDAREKEAYDKLKRRTLLVLEGIKSGKDNAEEIEAIDLSLLDLHKPKSFIGAESAEIKYDKQFETTCLAISQEIGLDAKTMTVLQFYNAVEHLKQQSEARAKSLKSNKPK